ANDPVESVGEPDYVIQNAVIYDGLGGLPFAGDVSIKDGLIDQIGDISVGSNTEVYNAQGLALSPGFIDPHSHHDSKLMAQPASLSMLAQGITTIVSGLDGGLSTYGDQFISIQNNYDVFEKTPASVNIAFFAPHDTYREIVMGDDAKRLATDAELDEMKALLRRDMQAGAFGLSTGLEYEPSVYSDTSEVIELAKVAAEFGGRYSSHIRSEDVAMYPAIEVVLTVAREANLPVNISHIKLAMYELHGQSTAALKILNAAREEGLDVTADIYPYDGWQSVLGIMIPSRDYQDRNAAQYALSNIAAPDTISIVSYDLNQSYEGKNLQQIADMENKNPVDMLMEMLQNADKAGVRIGVIGSNIGDADIKNFMQWPYTAITTDGGINDAHPRGQGTFTRVLGKYVREMGVLSLPEAIRKMTSLTASNLGITTRGTIKTGLAADLVLFDPATISDHATFENSLQFSTGIDTVWVNGEISFTDGASTIARPGVTLKRE
ncbi:MAG: D-aminoacylase, partial [Emcibacteraceae bacterium]|nr:D-aminoacylase [Emcibacteraceae bacterium]